VIERWKPVKGYEGLYEVSSLGRIKSLSKRIDPGKCHRTYPEKLIKPGKDGNGYLRVVLSDVNHKSKTHKLHRLVAEAFIPNPEKLPVVNHKDGNKANDRVDNLEWVSISDNLKHAYKNGLKSVNGAKNPAAKLTAEQVVFIKAHFIPRDNEYGCVALSKKFNVHRKTISRVVNNTSWKGAV
jgi:hypothetical protein